MQACASEKVFVICLEQMPGDHLKRGEVGNDLKVRYRKQRALADRIVASSPFVVGLGKKAFYRQLPMPRGEAYAYASEVMCTNAAADDAQEGMTAFLEKRAPVWRGR